MTRRFHPARFWFLLSLLMATVLFAIGRPLVGAWRCYRVVANGEHADALVLDKRQELGLILRIASGSQRGQACTASAPPVVYQDVQVDDTLSVVLQPGVPGECVLASTVQASVALLWIFSGAFASLMLAILLIGLFIHRSYTATGRLTSHMNVQAEKMTCPTCGAQMDEGYLPLLAALHWRQIGQPIGMPNIFSGLTGTVGWRSRPRLHGFRCETCRVITLQYGTL